MHVPDGLLDLRTASLTAGLSLPPLWLALRRLRGGLERRRIPLMGVAAAFLFAAQMLNFPVAAGTSGHLLGATLCAVLLGPAAAVLVVTAVLLVQCLLFADGGLLALGANVFNLAVAASLGGYGVYRGLSRLLPGTHGLLVAAAFGSWCSTVLAALCCALELACSGVARWGLLFPAMAGVHMVIGLGEAAITTLVLAAILKARPELLPASPRSPGRPRRLAAVGLAACFALLLFGLPFASSHPDGLERVAATLGFEPRATSGPRAPFDDYRVPGLGSAAAVTSAVGLLGAMVAFALAHILATVLAPRTGGARPPDPSS